MVASVGCTRFQLIHSAIARVVASVGCIHINVDALAWRLSGCLGGVRATIIP